MMQIGYARVSAQGQKLEAQLKALEAAGCERSYREKASGAARDRPRLEALVKALEAGDVVVVTRLDRLAGSTRDLPEIKALIQSRSIRPFARISASPATQRHSPAKHQS